MSLGLEPCLPVSPTDSQWMDLYEIAKKQSLIGVCFAGVQRLQKQYQSPPRDTVLAVDGYGCEDSAEEPAHE